MALAWADRLHDLAGEFLLVEERLFQAVAVSGERTDFGNGCLRGGYVLSQWMAEMLGMKKYSPPRRVLKLSDWYTRG